jgi:hypothetical protein
MKLWNKITEGYVKALGMIMGAGDRAAKRRAERKRFVYSPYGHAVHGRHYLNDDTRTYIGLLTDAISKAEDKQERDRLLNLLRAQPVKFVPVKRAERLDYGRYSGADIRAITKAGGGPKEKARAAKRARDPFPANLAAA